MTDDDRKDNFNSFLLHRIKTLEGIDVDIVLLHLASTTRSVCCSVLYSGLQTPGTDPEGNLGGGMMGR